MNGKIILISVIITHETINRNRKVDMEVVYFPQ